MASDFVLRQTSIALQNDLDKIERLLEIRSIGTGLRLDGTAFQLQALVSVEDNSSAPFEIADDGGYTIFRIDDEGEILTKAFDSREINSILRIYRIGSGLVFSNNTLFIDSTITNIKKIYSIGQGLTLNNEGQLFVNDSLFNLAKIYSIGEGLWLDSNGDLSANIKDVVVDNTSVVRNKVATITIPVKNVTVDGLNVVSGQVARITMPIHIENGEGAFEIADDLGNVALRITSTGHLLTKLFDSEEVSRLQRIYQIGEGLTLENGTLSATGGGGTGTIIDVRVDNVSVVTEDIANIKMPIHIKDTTPPFNLADEDGNIILQIKNNGHIQTCIFDSEEISRIAPIYTIGEGLTLSNNVLSAMGGGTGTITDVRVNHESVVLGSIADIMLPIYTRDNEGVFEIGDEDGNIAMQITSEGHIKTKSFDSSQTSELTDFKVVSSLPPPKPESPKVVYSLLDGRLYILDVGGASSSIVGIGQVGYMLVG